MPTNRRRLNLTLSDEVWLLVDEVHNLTGTPKSAVISEILDQVAPAFATTIQALRLAKESPRVAQELMQQMGDEAFAGYNQAKLDLDVAITADARTLKGKRAKTGGLRGRTP